MIKILKESSGLDVYFSNKPTYWKKNYSFMSAHDIGEVVAFIPENNCRILGIITEVVFTIPKVIYSFIGFNGLMVEGYSQRFQKITKEEYNSIDITDVYNIRNQLKEGNIFKNEYKIIKEEIK